MKLIRFRWHQLVVLISLSLLPFARSQAVTIPPHPYLLLNSNGIAELHQRIATAPWAAASWHKLKADADKNLAKPVELPPRGGNWSHNYVCPIHGARLERGRQIGPWQWEHICPVGDHVLKGDPSKGTLDFDGNVIMEIHQDFAQQVVDDGLMFQVTGDARYARHAREILLAYAAKYLSYPLHDNQGKEGGHGGRVASQSLTEASWLITLVQGADLVWDTLSADDRRAIEQNILRPALNQIIIPGKLGIHNIQCRLNSAIGLTGLLLGDQKLISLAIDDPNMGYRQQLAKGVNDDGLWLEGSSGYHFFTIEGLWPLAEAARNCGMDLYASKFKAMFDGPFSQAMPNLILPNFNDSGYAALHSEAAIYELAFARFHDPKYVSLFARRDNRMALLFGATNLPAGEAVGETSSRNLAAGGYAILQQGEGTNATWLAGKYGPHGGGHGHPDKNSFILYARGQVIAPDAGTHAYGSPLHGGWDKTTLAHNTLVVDGKSQEPAQGRCVVFGSAQGIDYSMTEAGRIYPAANVNFFRTTVLIATNLVVFVDQIVADAPHTYDLAYHQVGSWQNLPAGQAWSSPAAAGYKFFTKTTTRTSTSNVTVQTKVADFGSVTVTLAGGDATEIITGYGLMKTTADLVPMMLQRRHAQETAFVWAVSLEGAPVALKVSPVQDGSGNSLKNSDALMVQIVEGDRQWTLLANPHKKQIAAALPGGGMWRSEAAVAIH